MALLDLIRAKKLARSLKNKITVVFDGYPSSEDSQDLYNDNANINIIFSRKITADEKIKKIVEESANPRTIVVVSDDNEIKFMVKSQGARQMGIEDFIAPEEKSQRQPRRDLLKPELSYSQIHQINEELRKIWLK